MESKEEVSKGNGRKQSSATYLFDEELDDINTRQKEQKSSLESDYYTRNTAPSGNSITPNKSKISQGSFQYKEGRSSILKTGNSTTIYFGDDEDKNDDPPIPSEDTACTVNKTTWENFQCKLKDFRRTIDKKKVKEDQEDDSKLSLLEKEKIRNKINSVLQKAHKLHTKEESSSKIVIMRPEAKNLNKSISLVRIMDISEAEEAGLQIPPGTRENLCKYEDDILYLRHQQKMHIFPVDGVYSSGTSLENEIDQNISPDPEIFTKHFKNPLLRCLNESHNMCVFTGGQSYSGKEDCLFGDRLERSLVFESIKSIFDYILTDETKDFVLRISAFEIFNERIYDLLAINSISSKSKKTSFEQVTEEVCSSIQEIVSLWNLCLNNKSKFNSTWRKELEENKEGYFSRRRPKQFAHTVFKIVLEIHDKEVEEETTANMNVSSICFVNLSGIEGNIDCELLIEKNKQEKAKLKESEDERFLNLAQHDLTKSLAYLYKIFEELGNNKSCNASIENEYFNEIFEASKLTSFLKFYLANGNSTIGFVSCILPIELFSNFSHDCLHNASLIENIYTSKVHKSISTQEGFKSKYFEIKSEIQRIKDKINEASKGSKKDMPKYDLGTLLSEYGTKIDKLMQKILNSNTLRLQSIKFKGDFINRTDESGLFSHCDSDISRGAFEIGDDFLPNFELKKRSKEDQEFARNLLPEYFEDKSLVEKLDMVMDNQDLSELDNTKTNLMLDDSYLEMDSLSNLDQEQIKMIPFEKRLSLLIRRESLRNMTEQSKKLGIKRAPTVDVSPKFEKFPSMEFKKEESTNEKLLNALDDIEDNLVKDDLNFSFARISLLDFSERDSIVHGASFKDNKEDAVRISRRNSIRKSRISRKNSEKDFNLLDETDEGLLDSDTFENIFPQFELNHTSSGIKKTQTLVPGMAVFTIMEEDEEDDY
ncbi:unnamed protein product [Moneuplotes crassus]|uniref:Kinesin motor domain-containing protein n=1 Tax=Euplotes crassus TaxID=5936 RepID=A0AAD1XXR7_EUPCR|nr:unnamed protein product [Moneuplotes crassus]